MIEYKLVITLTNNEEIFFELYPQTIKYLEETLHNYPYLRFENKDKEIFIIPIEKVLYIKYYIER